MARRRTTDIFWRKADELPELQGVPAEERRALWKETFDRSAHSRKMLWAWPLALLVFAAIVTFGQWFFTSRFNPNLPRMLVLMTAGGVGGATVAAIMWVVHRRLIQRDLWRRLPHLCSACGYDLTGNASGTCPECGRAVPFENDAIRSD